MRRRYIALLLLASACHHFNQVRFQDRAILWHWPDDRPIPMPKVDKLGIFWEGVRDAVIEPADRVLSLETASEAGDINALDEMPDSTWFHDPRRVDGEPRPRRLTAQEMEWGALKPIDAPVLPLTVTEGKGIGATPGFVATDARGIKYLVKLDPLENYGLTTQTELVVTRLAWAAGWLVPGLAIVDEMPDALLLSPRAFSRDAYGIKQPFTHEQLAKMVQRMPRAKDGTVRMLVSRWLEGVNIGEFAYLGRRKDDPNDLVDHEHRRVLRAFGVFCSWVNNVDTLQNNTLDMYQGKPGQGHIVHYEQDIGGSFGNFAGLPEAYWSGTETWFDAGRVLRSLITLGLWPRPWDDASFRARKDALRVKWPELGNFDAERFVPRRWEPAIENQAFVRQTERDRYWGAKRVVAIDGNELRAAIGAGRYRPEAGQRLFDVLWRRRELIARDFYSRTAALDHFAITGRALCFDDLWIEAGLGGENGTAYQSDPDVVVNDRCLTLPDGAGYRVVSLAARRPGERRFGPGVKVHVMLDGAHSRILGVER
jgi:hypothetical protein